MWARARKVIAAISTPRPAPTPEAIKAKAKAEHEAMNKEAARRWEEAQEQEWRDRVEASNAALAAQLARQGYTDVGFTSGEIPVIDLSDGAVDLDIFGRVRRRPDRFRWR